VLKKAPKASGTRRQNDGWDDDVLIGNSFL